MKLDPTDIERGLEELLRLARRTPAVSQEFDLSLAEYFAHGAPVTGDDEARRAARRHLEWFLLERPSAALGGVPVEWALHGGLQDAGEDEDEDEGLTEEHLRSLLSSRCSVFEVTGIAEGEGVWVRDLGAMGEYPLHEPEGSHALEAGDVIVGRLYAVGESLYRVSPAAGVFRSVKLLRALTRDMEQLRKARRGVLRLSQAELESMFWQRVDDAASDDAVERARAFLVASGVGGAQADRLLAELGQAPFDEGRVVLGVRDVLGSILDRLAFETDIDLEAARRVLMEAWPLLAGKPPAVAPEAPATESRKPADVREAIAAFDRGRNEGRDLDKLFDQLERDLDLEPEPYDPDAIDGAPAPDFPGVVGAMVDEFLWETERERGEDAARELDPIRAFAEFGAEYGTFEDLGSRELVLFAAVWLPERRLLREAADATRMLAALREFCSWSQESQGVPLLDAYEKDVAPMERSLPRLVEANRLCRAGSSGASSEMFEVLAMLPSGARVRERGGDEREVAIDPRIARSLEPGDRLRGRRTSSGFELYCCYPAQSALVAG